MYNPRDFIPAKYKKKTDQVDSIADEVNEKESMLSQDSPWSDLAKEPEIPEYRNSAILDENLAKDSESAEKPISATLPNLPDSKTPFKAKKKSSKKIMGLLVVFFLVVGVFASYMLSRQNQDNRQQASGMCGGNDPYCNGINGTCIENYYLVNGVCERIPNTVDCGNNMHRIDGVCMSSTCRKLSNGNIICGYTTDQDACTEQSMGGDWCDNPNTSRVESCEESGLMRCQCSAGWWVIGKASSCSVLCDDANADCTDCATPTPTPTNPPNRTPTPTPTTPPTLLACGEMGCNRNSDCQDGLTCQSVTVNGQAKKICSKGENQLFCAANPTTANCCESQSMPVCANIDMLDASNNTMDANDDDSLKDGDEVRFRCTAAGNQGVDFDYEFRIWAPGSNSWTNITDYSGTVAKNVSDSYTISRYGNYVVQGRICWENDCQVWEIVDGSPTITANRN